MQKVQIFRTNKSDQGTFGNLVSDGFNCVTGELPWHDNKNGISCIPEGTYICKIIDSPKHGKCYQVMNVPKRSMIEIHSANWMGDAPKWKKQLEGCIALGDMVGTLDGQLAVLRSKVTVDAFEKYMNDEDFELTIS